MKLLQAIITLAFIFIAIQDINASMLADFDFVNNDITQGFDRWYYSPYNDISCPIYNSANQSKMCSTDSNEHTRSFFYYYNGYNSDHMDWMRWGFIDSESSLVIDGSSLKIVFTGGAYNDNGSVAYSGLEIRSKEQFNDYINNGQNPYADRILPGGLTMYFKGDGDFNTFEEFSGSDRLSLWILPPENSPYTFENQKLTSTYTRPEALFSWYPFVDDAGSDHYYHHLANINMGGWIHMIFDAHPVHNNSGDNNPYDYYRVGGYDYPGDAISYFEHINAFAIKGAIIKDLESPSFLYLDEIKAYKVNQPENDETIANIGIGYDFVNKRFDISFDDKYRCADCNAKYEVRYSFYPITNVNYNLANLCHVTNFDRNIIANPGEIIKPSNGYSQIWAGIDVDKDDKQKLVNDATIYFAVKDISNRSNLINRDTYDLEMISVPGFASKRRIDLIKTIDYTIYPVNRSLTIKTNNLQDAHVGMVYDVLLEARGGQQPYLWSTISNLPDGVTLISDGKIIGNPLEPGKYNITIRVTDSGQAPQTTEVNLEFNIYNQEICTDNIDNDNDSQVDCQDIDCEDNVNCSDILVDFGATMSDNIFGTSWANVFMDTYTDYVSIGPKGTKTVVGNNGSYNYQGLSGNVINFNEGDKIKVYWYNNTSNVISFASRLSFDDNNRESSVPNGAWHSMSYATIDPLSIGTNEYIIDSANAGNHALVNISSNSNGSDNLVCDKIIWVHSGKKNPTVRMDVNQDQVINMVDALLVLRKSLGLIMTNTSWKDEINTGDVDCNNISNFTDAMLILRYSLGLIMDDTEWCEDN